MTFKIINMKIKITLCRWNYLANKVGKNIVGFESFWFVHYTSRFIYETAQCVLCNMQKWRKHNWDFTLKIINIEQFSVKTLIHLRVTEHTMIFIIFKLWRNTTVWLDFIPYFWFYFFYISNAQRKTIVTDKWQIRQ